MVEVIKERVEGGRYAVDPHAVAEAMLARREEGGRLGSLWSEVLVAAQLATRPERDPLSGFDVP